MYSELIESARMYTYGKCNKVIQLKLKVGVTFNIAVRTTVQTHFYIIEDSIAKFNPDSIEDGKNLFELDDKKQVVFTDGTSGIYDWDGMWKVMEEHNLIVTMK